MGNKEDREAERRDLERVNARKRAERDAAILRGLEEEAAQEERQSKLDDAFMREARDVFGVELEEIEQYARDHADELIDGAEAHRVIQQARKQAKGGWLTRPNPRKAVKTLRGSKAVRDAAEKSKKDGCFGCAVFAVLMLSGAAWAVTRGVVELVSALGV